MKIGAIIQARTSSTRFPKKILKDLPYNSGVNVLQQVIRRLKLSKLTDEIVVATTTEQPDDVVVKVASQESVKSFRGSKENVLERYYLAAMEYNLEVIVRITSDCPCIDPIVVDEIINEHLKTGSDYTSNTMIRTFPVGLDVEVFNFKALEKAYHNGKGKMEKEHVTFYFHTTARDLFKTTSVTSSEFNEPDIRITLDTQEDYALLCAIFDYLYPKNEFFTSQDLINLFKGLIQ